MASKIDPAAFLRKHKADAVLVLSLILISAVLLVVLLFAGRSGDEVKVEVDGVVTAVYPLSEDGEYRIGEGNTLVIEGGAAYMKDASCPDHTCVRTGRISKNGQTIICLPNKVAVTVISRDGGADLES